MATTTATREDRPSSSLIGALVALGLGCSILVGVAIVEPFGPTTMVFERPEVLMAGLALTAGLGWRLGRSVPGKGVLRLIGLALAFGLLWPPVVVLVAVVAGFFDGLLRGAAGPLEVGPTVVWALYGLSIAWFYGRLVAVPAGLVWALLTRAIGRVTRVRIAEGGGHPTTRLVVALVAIGLTVGTVQAATYGPWDARCLNLPGGAPTDAAFSPAGDLLAVTLESDPNAIGSVLLLSWPSAEVLASWSAWVGDAVAVDPDGRVYWSAWVLGPFPMDEDDIEGGIYTATPGSEPTWFATGAESQLNDLTWTREALRGTTPNSHRVARIPTTGDHRLQPEPGPREIGAFWSSPDGSITVTGPTYFGTALEIRANDGRTRSVASGEARSVGLSGDGLTLVVAGWFSGTRLIDVETGESRLVLNGSQVFVAVSETGDVAWANEEQFGVSQLCTSTLELLR